jgi:hypothetical protein
MKHYFLLLIFGIILLSCSNDGENSDDLQLIGTWNWIVSSGGIDGRTETPESTGTTVRLEISNNTIKRYLNNNLQNELSYTLEFRESMIFGESREMIIYENQFNQTIHLSANQLILYDECNDCFQSTYERD